MMPIQSFSSFQRMTQFCRTKVPDHVWQDLSPIKNDDEAVKSYGVQLCVDMCKVLSLAGIAGFHFYTLNLEKSVLAVLKELNIEESTAARR
jgi:methylenetetrahydrofolate reductase (NADPH)